MKPRSFMVICSLLLAISLGVSFLISTPQQRPTMVARPRPVDANLLRTYPHVSIVEYIPEGADVILVKDSDPNPKNTKWRYRLLRIRKP